MSDVKDMLGVAQPAAPRQDPIQSILQQRPPKVKKTLSNQSRALPRQLRILQSDDELKAQPVMPVAPMFKSKKKRQVRWKQEAIRSSARCAVTGKMEDDVELMHWVKVLNVPDYRFARANKEVRMLEYTDVEYETYLQDPSWSRAQTDFLMMLCKRFDLRFVVIHDRFTKEVPWRSRHPHKPASSSSPSSSAAPGVVDCNLKTLEDLKHRFYSVQRQLTKLRDGNDPEIGEFPVMKYPYDPEYEAERRIQLARFHERTQDQVNQVAALVLENRQITAQIKRMKKAAKASGTELKSSIKPKKPTKRAAGQMSTTGIKKTVSVNWDDVDLEKGKMAPIPEACVAKNLLEVMVPGVKLASAEMAGIFTRNITNSKLRAQIDTELGRMGLNIKNKPFRVPTQEIFSEAHKIRADVLTLLNLKKANDRLQGKTDETGSSRWKKRKL